MRENLFQLLESSGGELSAETILLRLAVSAVLAAFLFLSNRLSHSGSIYSAKFNVSLVALTVITTTVMIVIGNNIALSLGMVGACPSSDSARPSRTPGTPSISSGPLWWVSAVAPATTWWPRQAARWCSCCCWCLAGCVPTTEPC